MKCHRLKEFADLTPSSQSKLQAIMEDCAQKAVDREESILQEIWIKISCLILSDMHFSEETVTEYIGAFKMKYKAYKKNAKNSNELGMDWLNKQINERFPDFPQAFLDGMKGEQ